MTSGLLTRAVWPTFVCCRAWAVALLVFSLTGCRYNPPSNEAPEPTSGSANFQTYVALGNSLTAGFADGALYREAQQQSYPVLLAQQMRTALGVPLMPEGDGFGGQNADGSFFGRRLMRLSESGISFAGTAGTAPLPYSGDAASLGNFGVPGAKLADLLAGDFASRSPFYARFAGTAPSLLDQVMARNPTFFTLWAGNNDVLGYASTGGEGDVLTPTAVFAANLSLVVDRLLANGAKGALATVPDVTAIPFFNVVTDNVRAVLPIDIPEPFLPQLPVLNSLVAQYGVRFDTTGNRFLVELGDGTVRMMNLQHDYLLLNIPLDSLLLSFDENTPLTEILAKWGVTKPIPSQYVLDSAEVAAVRARTLELNALIAAQVAAHPGQLALVDMYAFIETFRGSGVPVEGARVSADFPFGGAFSLDGIHPTPRGAALIANEFARAINLAFGSTIQPLRPMDYRANTVY